MRYWLPAAVALALCVVGGALSPALCAPARLNDDVPDAVPDPEGMWSFSYGYGGLNLDGPLAHSSSTSGFYKLRYAFTPDVSAQGYFISRSLGGDVALVSPLLDNQESASEYGVDLAINLLNQPSKLNDPHDPKSWVGGSAFGVGVGLSRLNLSAAALAQKDTLMRAYLQYSTDLSNRLRAHTYFSTGRVSGDTASGSMNRVAAGADYSVTTGEHPLTFMADAVLDIYNFRQPTFNTSRISSFDLGARYGLSRSLFANLGYLTYNDSENNASGSGLFAGVQYRSAGRNPRVKCAPAPCPAPGPPPLAPPPPAGAAVPAPSPGAAAAPPTASPAATSAPAPAAPPAPPPAAEPPKAEAPASTDELASLPEASVGPASSPPLLTPPPATVQADDKAFAPLRQRVVSSLRSEFGHAAQPGLQEQQALAETPREPEPAQTAYDPHSWSDQGKWDAGVSVPPLKDVRANTAPDSGWVAATVKKPAGKQIASAKVKPKDDPTVVEVTIAPAPKEDSSKQ